MKIKASFRSFASLGLAIGILGCGYGNKAVRVKGYTLGEESSSTVGSVMIYSEDKIKKVPRKLSKAAGKEEKLTNISVFREELIYAGKSGSIINISYREYAGDSVRKEVLARPAFFQQLQYDLSESKDITFKSYKLRIVNATNEKILFSVLED